MDIEHTRKLLYEKISTSPELQSVLYPYIVQGYAHSKNENGVFLNISALSPENLHVLFQKVSENEQYIVLRESQLAHSIHKSVAPAPPTTHTVKSHPTYTPFHLTRAQHHLLTQKAV